MGNEEFSVAFKSVTVCGLTSDGYIHLNNAFDGECG